MKRYAVFTFAVIWGLAVASPAFAQNCKKGKPCGRTCIAQSRTCRIDDGSTKSSEPVAPVSMRVTMPARSGAVLPCTVAKITDGDTLRCEEYRESVRLLLIDTPEMSQGSGDEARAELLRLVPIGSIVVLEFDVDPMDRYGRALAYVRMLSGQLANVEMARSGYALSLTYPPNVKFVDEVRAAVEEAKAAKRGLWSGSAFECSPKSHRDKMCD